MRPFESLILTLNLAIILSPLLPIHKKPRWVDFLPGISVLLTIMHLIVEKYRWQMVPVYLLTALLFLLMLRRLARPAAAEKQAHKTRTIVVSLLGVLLLAFTAAPPILLPVAQLPDTTGPYEIGTVTYHLIDPTRNDIYAADPTTPRELMVQIWYPADPAPDAKPAPWIADAAVIAPQMAASFDLPSFFLDHTGLMVTHSFPEAPLSAAQNSYPVLIFSHGWTGLRTQNTYQVEELASHGYVVVALDHTYGTVATVFPDGRLVTYNPDALPADVTDDEFNQAANRLVTMWAGDVRFVLDQLALLNTGVLDDHFTGRLDLERIGIFGHSTGGGTAVEVCWLDDRCKAGLALDVWMIPVSDQAVLESLDQPFMFMRSEVWSTAENDSRTQQVYKGLRSDGYHLTIEGTRHYDFTDLPLLSPVASAIGLKGPIESQRVIQIINNYILAFFDKHLAKGTATLLDGPSLDYPEVEFEQRGRGNSSK